MYFKTEAIVLREVEYQDADKLLDLLSKDRGLLTVRAKGVRRGSSPLKSACQLLTASEFTLFDYRGKLTVQEAQPLEQFRALREDLELLALGSYLAQATGTVAQEDAPNPALYALLCNALYALGQLRRPPALVKAAFELRLACLAGFEPDLAACPVCGSPNPDRFDPASGAALCVGCGGGEAQFLPPLTPDLLTALRYIVWCAPKRLFSFRLEGESLRALSALTENYLIGKLEQRFSTLDFYKTLLHYGEPAL